MPLAAAPRLTAVPDSRFAPADPAPKRRRSRAKARPARAREVVATELRGLGGLVLEQALLQADARPLRSLTDWAARLTLELGQDPGAPAATYAELMHRIAAIARRAAGDPRPTVALPRAA